MLFSPRSVRLNVIMLCATLPLVACDPNPDYTHIDKRVMSPDGQLEAVYAEDLGGGAATGTSFDIYVVKPGHFPRLIDRVFGKECVQDVDVEWEGSQHLQITYSIGSVVHDDTERFRPWPPLWLTPWLWGRSPAEDVQVSFTRHVIPIGC